MFSSSKFAARSPVLTIVGLTVLAAGFISGPVESAVAVGEEFRINDQVWGDQNNPAVALDIDGNQVIAWEGGDGSGKGVFIARFAVDGSTLGLNVRANAYTAGDQQKPSLAADAEGNFVVAWQSDGQDGEGWGVYARRFKADGTPLESEFRVNNYTPDDQASPAVAMEANGDFIVTWNSQGQDGSNLGVYAQRYDASGNALGGEFRVNCYTLYQQFSPAVAMDANGDFLVTWTSYGQDGSEFGVYARRYGTDGISHGCEFRVNSYTFGHQWFPTVAMDADGDFVVAWQDGFPLQDGQDGSGIGVYGQRYDANGIPLGGEFRINTYTTGNQANAAVAMDADGDFVVTWQNEALDGSGWGVYAQRYDASGAPLGEEFRINSYTTGDQYLPAVATDAIGDFLVVWQSESQDGDGLGIYGQRYFGSGQAVRPQFGVNLYVTDDQREPTVAMDADGDFVVAWSGPGPSDDEGIYLRRYNAFGNAIGGELRVNSYTTGRQNSAAAAMDSDGDFVVTWQSSNQDGDGWGIYAQRFDRTGNPAGFELQVNTQTANDQLHPAVAMDSDGGFVVVWDSVVNPLNTGVFARRFTADGVPQGPEFQVASYSAYHQRYPTVAIDADGDFVVAWQRLQLISNDWDVYARRFAADGTPHQQEDIRVNTHTALDQARPSVAMDSDGYFVVAWMSEDQDGDGWGVYAQRFSADGARLGTEIPVNTRTTDGQGWPVVAMDSDGDFVVAWDNEWQVDYLYDVYAQRFDSAGLRRGGEFRVNTFTLENQRVPDVAMDADGDFVIAWYGFWEWIDEGDGNDISARPFHGPGCYGNPLYYGYTAVGACARLDCISYDEIFSDNFVVELGGELIMTAPSIHIGGSTRVQAGAVFKAGP